MLRSSPSFYPRFAAADLGALGFRTPGPARLSARALQNPEKTGHFHPKKAAISVNFRAKTGKNSSKTAKNSSPRRPAFGIAQRRHQIDSITDSTTPEIFRPRRRCKKLGPNGGAGLASALRFGERALVSRHLGHHQDLGDRGGERADLHRFGEADQDRADHGRRAQ